MTNDKVYFEKLEEEFQSVSSQLQHNLTEVAYPSKAQKAAKMGESPQDRKRSSLLLKRQLGRCHEIYKTMTDEVQGNVRFNERLVFYQIQLDQIQDEYDDCLLRVMQNSRSKEIKLSQFQKQSLIPPTEKMPERSR
eukprot:Nitzschia sp. Nitz4//scaffold151_size53849//26763//27170//NITZ4_006723-RA/size53849-processed-gene-0.49-mRNA-1//-1//CDS//3329537144//2832//frame0